MSEGLIAISIGSTVAKSVFGFTAAEAANKALEEKELENKVAANDQSIQRGEVLKKTLGAQIAQSAAFGITASSASLQAIQISDFNKAAEDTELAGLELDVENENLEQQKRNNNEKAMIGAVDNLFAAAKFFEGLPDVGEAPGKFNVFGQSSSLAEAFRKKRRSGLFERFGVDQDEFSGGGI